MNAKLSLIIGVFLIAVLVMPNAGLGQKAPEGKSITKAVAVLHPTEGNQAQGVVTFTKVSDGVRITAHVEGLTPGRHGFHIHEFGDCSSPDANSAGGHFSPQQMPHGAPDDMKRHAGDMGNLEADSTGTAHLEWTDKVMTFTGSKSIIGHAVVVHAGRDDLKTQPTGDSGGRIACGVIGIAK